MSAHFRTPQTLRKTVAATGTPERLSSASCPVSNAILIGCKAEQTDNATTIYIGPSSVNGKQPIPISPGGQYALAQTDLYDWYVDVGTAGDGVVVVYW